MDKWMWVAAGVIAAEIVLLYVLHHAHGRCNCNVGKEMRQDDEE